MSKIRTKWIEDGAITYTKIDPSSIGTGPTQLARGDHSHPSPTGFYSNVLINADFNVAQRGTSFTQTTAGTYPLDCWYFYKSGDMEIDTTRSSDTPTVVQSGHHSRYCLEMTCSTQHTSSGSDDQCYIAQGIEGAKFHEYIGLDMILTFWVYTSVPGTYCVSFTNRLDRSCVVEYTVNTANTWQLIAIILPLSFSGGTWNNSTGLGLMIAFSLAPSALYTASSNGAWEPGYHLVTSNQVDFTATQGAVFRLAQVQFKRGNQTSIFQGLHFPTEYQICQRYYEKTYSHLNPPGTNTTEGVLSFPYLAPSISSWSFSYRVEKRSNPTVTFYDIGGHINCTSAIDSTGVIIDNLNVHDTASWRDFIVLIGRTGLFIKHRSKFSDLFTFYVHYELQSYLI